MRVGIIGAGEIAASHLEGYRRNGIEVSAVADVDAARLGDFVKTHSVAHAFESGKELIDSGLVEAVSICTPPVYHETDALAALRRNVSVLCEKPLSHSLESARRIAQAVESARKAGSPARFATAFRHRFLPAIRMIRDLLDDGGLGAPIQMYNHFAGYKPGMRDTWFAVPATSGGGCLIDTTSHSIDIFRFLFGEIIEHRAELHTVQEGLAVEDTSVLLVRSASDVIGTLSASWMSGDSVAYVDVICTGGRVWYDYLDGSKLAVKTRDGKWEYRTVVHSNGFTEQIASFVTSILDGSIPECPVDAGLAAASVVFSEYSANGRSER